MHLLLTNDDGISSHLLQLLCRAAGARGHHVTVAAPATQQSAKSHAFTVFTPLMVRPVEMEGAAAAWAVEGTPVDSCRLGLMALADTPVDLVISGINYGYNVGLATYVSGTVGAAREAAFQKVPAIAASCEPWTPEETQVWFADYVVRTAERLIDYAAPELSVCNVNAPPIPVSQLKAPVMATLNRNIYHDEYERRESPRGGSYFWLKPIMVDDAPTPGGDQDMLNQGHVTVTFLTPEGCDQQDYCDFPVPLF